MKITRVKINNYRSVGSEQNCLHVEPQVTALIGKNESGKSNILEAVGRLSFLEPLNKAYLLNKNRHSAEGVSISVDLEFEQHEMDAHGLTSSITSIHLDGTQVAFEGGLAEILCADRQLMEAIGQVCETKNDKSVWGSDNNRLKIVNDTLARLEDVATTMFGDYDAKLRQLKGLLLGENKDELANQIELISNRLQGYYDMLPRMHYWEMDREFQYSYSYSDIEAALDDDKHMFNRFLKAAGIDRSEMTTILFANSDGVRANARDNIEEKIKFNIEKRFNEFYTQEPVRIRCELENKEFKTFISTSGDLMELTERSNGLRWYLGLFIDTISYHNQESSTPIVYLLDEPGVHLHVNAQKELLKLFYELTDERNQVIYTTHSPYMIDNRDILNVRAIQKDENGNTRIFRNAYDSRLSKASKMETLSPVAEALGVNLQFNLGPSMEANIVTEGISDYMYVKAMMDHFEIPNPPYIIPSAGVTNINRIVSILIGWGYDFTVLLDYDKEGCNEYRKLSKYLGDAVSDKVVFVTGVSEVDQEEEITSPKTIESLISEEDQKKLSIRYDEPDSKTLAAREFHDRLKRGELDLGEETMANFRRLFSALGMLDEEVHANRACDQ